MFWIFNYLKKKKGLISLTCLFLFLQTLGTLTIPTFTANIINNGVAKSDLSYMIKTGVYMILAAFLSGLCAIAAAYQSSRLSSFAGRELRIELFAKVQRLSLVEFDTVGSSSMITRSTGDIVQIQQALLFVFQFLLPVPFMTLSGLLLGLSKDKLLTSVLVSAMVIYVFYGYLIGKQMVPITKKMQIKMDRINRTLLERLSGVRVIRAFNQTQSEQDKFAEVAAGYTDTAISLNKVYAVTYGFVLLTMNLIIVLFLWIGGARIFMGVTKIGDIMAFIEYATLILSTLNMGIMTVIYMYRAQASVERVREVLDKKENEPNEQLKNQCFQSIAEELTFNHVDFGYNGAAEPVLKNVCFTAKKGQTTAIIGSTGSGKSTILKLILGFYSPLQGTININGVDISTVNEQQLRQKIGFVPQKPFLFRGTIRENICYGNRDAVTCEIKHSAKIAQAHEFIENMQYKYESLISQEGENLSGGQKQRLAIARAVVKEPEIYLFDDSFSALDQSTDLNLRAALNENAKESIVIIVAQRIRSIEHAEQIVVLDKGVIAGIGTHKELLQTCNIYQQIASSQFSKEEMEVLTYGTK